MKEIKIYLTDVDLPYTYLFDGLEEQNIDYKLISLSDHKAVVETMQKRIDELEAEKNKSKAELLSVMKFLSDENKTELEISYYEKLASDWMDNWIKD